MTFPPPDEDEVIRWISQGRSYAWMCQEYERKYNIRTKITTWARYRQRHGLPVVFSRCEEVIPWTVQYEHKWTHARVMLHIEVRRHKGVEPSYQEELLFRVWRDLLAADDLVVDYDPTTDAGFSYVPRRPGIDLGLIREPGATSGRP